MSNDDKKWERWTPTILYAAELAAKTGETQYIPHETTPFSIVPWDGKTTTVVDGSLVVVEQVKALTPESMLLRFIHGSGELNCYRVGFHEGLKEVQRLLEVVECADELRAALAQLQDANLKRTINIPIADGALTEQIDRILGGGPAQEST